MLKMGTRVTIRRFTQMGPDGTVLDGTKLGEPSLVTL